MSNWFKRMMVKIKGQKGTSLENWWNTRRPTANGYTHRARDIGGKRITVDPRVFFATPDNRVPWVLAQNSNDVKALRCLEWVVNNITYVRDPIQFKAVEEWLFAFETVALRKGDCEDGAILMANMMLKAGIPYWRIRLNAGKVKGGGHCWVTYLREIDNRWIVLDWCYNFYPNGQFWKEAKDYYDIWFSWTTKDIFKGARLDR